MKFEKLDSYLNSLADMQEIGYFGCAVHIDGKEVYRGGNDMPNNDFFYLYSVTKLLTAVSAMQLIEQNRLGLYDKVSDYLPAFEKLEYMSGNIPVPCSTPLRIWHLLTMSGGFDYNDSFNEMQLFLKDKGQVKSEEVLSLLAERTLSFEPGTHYQYSLGLDILGSVIEKVSGMPLDKYMEVNIFNPIGSRDLTFYPNAAQFERMPPQRTAMEPNKELGRNNIFLSARHFPSGGAGLCGTVNDYMLFLDALCCGEAIGTGKRLLREETLNLMRTPMLPESAQRELRSMRTEPEIQVLGLRSRNAEPGLGIYTGDGAAGAFAAADKEKRMSIFFAAHLHDYAPFYSEIHPNILHIVYDIIS